MVTLQQIQDGIVLPLDKPRQWTSFQAVNKIKAVVRNRYGLKKFKIGHAGTLDPLATGLLLVCLGKATKTIPQLQDGDKVYTGTMVLGATTPCYDMERAIDQYFPFEHITPTLLDEKRRLFEGEIMQVPPMFSAVKIDGQRAYEYARINEEEGTRAEELKARQVKIYSFERTAFREGERLMVKGERLVVNEADAPNNRVSPLTTNHSTLTKNTSHLYDNPQCIVPSRLPQVDFRIHCGKGTYIRSLARDLNSPRLWPCPRQWRFPLRPPPRTSRPLHHRPGYNHRPSRRLFQLIVISPLQLFAPDGRRP